MPGLAKIDRRQPIAPSSIYQFQGFLLKTSLATLSGRPNEESMNSHIPLALIIVSLAMSASDDPGKSDLARFQGDWQMKSAVRDGKELPAEDARKITLN